MAKTPSTPNELLAMQADRDPVQALFELNEQLEVSTTGAQRQALALAAHLLDLHEETLKEHSKDMNAYINNADKRSRSRADHDGETRLTGPKESLDDVELEDGKRDIIHREIDKIGRAHV